MTHTLRGLESTPKIFLCLLMMGSSVLANTGDKVLKASNAKGGLVVVIGCDDPDLITDLHASGSFLIHGLDQDAGKISVARQRLREEGVYGKVAVDIFDGKNLPYMDNLVNLILVLAPDCAVPASEIDRALAPRGVIVLDKAGNERLCDALGYSPVDIEDGLVKYTKPVPTTIGDWPHYLHGADNNAVSSDTVVGPPRRLQWQCGPLWSRSHEADMSMTGAVSVGGKIFYFIDEGPIGLHDTPEKKRWMPDKASLVCRDAFNGIELWRRRVPNWGGRAWDDNRLAPWARASERVFSSPLTLPRRLVAAGNRLFVTLGYRTFLTELDAVTGETVREYREIGNVDEILAVDGKLILRVPQTPSNGGESTLDSIAVVEMHSGQTLWKKEAGCLGDLTLAAANGRICYCNKAGVTAWKLETGELLWQTPVKQQKLTLPTLVMHKDVVILANNRQAYGFDITTGKLSWQKTTMDSFRGPPDALVINDQLWLGTLTKTPLDPRTGVPGKGVDARNLFTPGHHVRCYRGKGTGNYLMWSKRGVEFVDLRNGPHSRNDWVRGACRYGLMPANGMIYMPPTSCFCFPGVKLNGFNALAPATTRKLSIANPLEKGLAYDKAVTSRPAPSDWPTYRHDNARSGAAATEVPSKVQQAWKVKVGGQLTPPVLACGRLYVADKDSHAIHCLEASSGNGLWLYTAGGRVDSAPTVDGGRVLFGCTDGWVYCLRADNGELIWRFRAAPRDQRIVSYGQLQSSWPVHGSVLVQNQVGYVAAGRSSFLDGGLFLFGLDVATGDVRCRQRLDGPWPDSKAPSKHGAHWMDGGRTDILVCNNDKLYMLQNVFDLQLNPLDAPVTARHGARKMERHLIASGGFLDNTGFDRVYWMHAALWPGLYYGYRAPKTGQILVFDQETTYALKTFSQLFSRSPYFSPGRAGHDLVADDNDNEPILTSKDAGREREPGYSRENQPKWSVKVPVQARAMVLAGETLFLAGAPDVVDPADPLAAIEGRSGAKLQAIATADGSCVADYPLDTPPVFDGMIAAGEKLYISMQDGTIRCWSK